MLFPFLRSSPAVAAGYSWWQGTRLRCSGTGHQIRRHNAILRGTHIELIGRDCRLTIDPGARLWDCAITVAGDGAELHVGADCRLRQARLNVEDPGSRLVIGARTIIIGATLLSQEGRLLLVGADSMIAQHAEVRNSDSHAIYDHSGARTNPAEDIVLGRHVWVGLGACIFRGARIGDGSVIGARALVTGHIPPDCVAYGVPAVPRRTAIHWHASRTTPTVS